MVLTKEQREEFEKASEPLIKFLCDNFHPHVKVIVDPISSEILEGSCSILNDKHVKD